MASSEGSSPTLFPLDILPRDPAAETSHLKEDGSKKRVKRTPVESERIKNKVVPVVPIPKTLREKPTVFWWQKD